MIEVWHKKIRSGFGLQLIVIVGVLIGVVVFGMFASSYMLFAVGAAIGGIFLLRQPLVGLIFLILVALLVPIEIDTGTEVSLNLTVFLIPVVLIAWILSKLTAPHFRIVGSKTFLPLMLFLVMGLLSLMIGNILWDPLVPKSSNFILVQLAQWAIFALSGLIFFLTANMVGNEKKLRYLVLGFLAIAGLLAIVSMFVGAFTLVKSVTTVALIRTPFWILLSGIAGGQLLFNPRLNRPWRMVALSSLLAVFVYAFFQQQEAVSNWVGVTTVVAVLSWLRWPRLRIPALIFTMLLILTGVLTQTLWNFGGGDSEWITSGGSRIALFTRVIDVTSSNPVTGLGPASYRSYAAMVPLKYGKAYWVDPSINSHNNYIDIFSQTGLIGLGLFLWFMGSVLLLALRLARRYKSGFVAGYATGMLAAWFAIMVVMLLLDWFLPFVYNVGFPGFQASVLVWLFFGGLVAIESWPKDNDE